MKNIYAILPALFMLTSYEQITAQTYCTPTYTSLCSSGDYIDQFSTTGGTTNITNLYTGCNGNPNNYVDYTASHILTITPGGTFNFTLQSGSSWSQGFAVWIDYNDNGFFNDPGEYAWSSGYASTSPFYGSITVPTSATGITVMRVRCAWATVPGPADDCSNLSFGETEDYGVVFCVIPPAPTVTSPVTSCVGASATLNASVSSGTLNWYNVSTGGTSQGTGPSFNTPVFTSAGPDTFWVASENGGCSSPRVPVLVNVAAAATVNIGPDITVCASSVTLDAGNPGSVYLWSSGQGTQTISVSTSGTYSVSLITPAGCNGSDAITVTLNTPPPYTLGNDTSTCGAGVLLDAGSGYTNYSWTTGAGTQSITVSTNDTVGVTVTDANGCVMSDTIIVSLSPSPVVNIGPDVTQCGGSVVLNAGNPGNLYFWSNSTSAQTTTVTASGTYFVNVLTPAGCSDADTVNVTINDQPVVDLGPDTSICVPSVVLDAGNPGSTYQWSNFQTTQAVTVSSGTYHVLVTDPSGCFDRDTVTVTTNTTPNVSVSADTSICPGGTAMLSASGALTYLWSNNSTSNPTSVSPATNTAYYVTGTDANGCQASDVVIVTILPTATAQFTASVDGVTAYFINQSSGAVTYSWNFGDASPVNNTATPAHTYMANGTYTVTLTVSGVCGTDTYTQVITITEVGVGGVQLENSISIYPNPNNGAFTVSFAMSETQDVTIAMTDVAGRVISSARHNNVAVVNQQMDASGLSSGVYFVRVITAHEAVTKKVIIQR
jgi:PKD repeat protein